MTSTVAAHARALRSRRVYVVVDDSVLRDGEAPGLLSELQSRGAFAQSDVEHSTFQLEPAGHVENDAHA